MGIKAPAHYIIIITRNPQNSIGNYEAPTILNLEPIKPDVHTLLRHTQMQARFSLLPQWRVLAATLRRLSPETRTLNPERQTLNPEP